MGVLATDWPDNPVQDERQLCLYYRTPASGTCISLSAAPRWEFASLTCARARAFLLLFYPLRSFLLTAAYLDALWPCARCPRDSGPRVDAGFPRFGTRAWERDDEPRGVTRGVASSTRVKLEFRTGATGPRRLCV